MLDIELKTLPHSEQRYPTVGDWKFGNTSKIEYLDILVSDMKNPNFEFLVAIHELIEAWLCKNAGISDESVTAFDTEYENKRQEGDFSEPGDSILCPCYKQHQIATGIEKILAAELGVNWKEYEDTVNSL